jgi:hypothetical protein
MRVIIPAKTGEFGSSMKCLPPLDDLSDVDEPIFTWSAMRHFIFIFGPDFDTIPNNFGLAIFLVPGILKIGQHYWSYAMTTTTQ